MTRPSTVEPSKGSTPPANELRTAKPFFARPRPWEIKRRAVLRGAGVAIGLPLLEAMIPGEKRARAAGTAPPSRLFLYLMEGGTPDTTGITGGGRPGSLWPRTPGANYETTELLKPFADLNLKQDITVVSNLHNDGAYGPNLDPPYDSSNHTQTMAGIFTGVAAKNIDRPERSAAISVDQLAANTLKKFTPALPYLFLQPHINDVYGDILSWSTPTTRVIPTLKPSEAFLKVFGEAGDPKALQRRLAYRKSILHYAADEIGRLKSKLGKADQTRVDQYLTSIGDLETRISAAGNSSANACGMPGQSSDNAAVPDLVKQMLDLIVLAFACDRTRVAVLSQTFNLLHYEWLGPSNSPYEWHGDVQHGAEFATGAELERRYDAYTKGCAWSMAQFGYFIDKLKTTSDADGSKLIDGSLLALTSEMSYGNGHWTPNVPVIVAGKAGGVTLGQGKYFPLNRGQPIANLWVTMLNGVGVPTTSFGNSTGALTLS